jgi:hypothetical protein
MEQNVERRAHPRYAVSNLEFIKARFDRSSSVEQILTIGAGGCGFVGFDRVWEKSDIKRVNTTFEIKLSEKIGPITIQGNIVYVKPVTIGGRSLYYYGIQFLPQDAHRMKPVIEALEKLSKEGGVSLADSY